MTGKWQRFVAYTKLLLICLVGLYAILFLILNRNNQGDVHLVFHNFKDVPMVVLLPAVGVGSVLLVAVVKRVFRVIAEVRRLRREKQPAKPQQKP